MIIKIITNNNKHFCVIDYPYDCWNFSIGETFGVDFSLPTNYEYTQCEVDEIWWEDDNTKVYSVIIIEQ